MRGAFSKWDVKGIRVGKTSGAEVDISELQDTLQRFTLLSNYPG